MLYLNHGVRCQAKTVFSGKRNTNSEIDLRSLELLRRSITEEAISSLLCKDKRVLCPSQDNLCPRWSVCRSEEIICTWTLCHIRRMCIDSLLATKTPIISNYTPRAHLRSLKTVFGGYLLIYPVYSLHINQPESQPKADHEPPRPLLCLRFILQITTTPTNG